MVDFGFVGSLGVAGSGAGINGLVGLEADFEAGF